MSEKAEVTRWGIVGACGLYEGQWQTRRSAIAGHTADVRRFDEPDVSRFAWGELSDGHRRIWARCQRRGDRAVKLRILIDAPPG